jgi:hypothetical protein
MGQIFYNLSWTEFCTQIYQFAEVDQVQFTFKSKVFSPIHLNKNSIHMVTKFQQNQFQIPRTATQGFHYFITERCYRALLYPPSLLNTQFADFV